MVGHAFVILRINIAHVYQRVSQLVLSTVGVGADNGIDGLVAHGVDMHGDALCIHLARDICNLLFGPVGKTLMAVWIQRVYISGTAFHRAVHEEFEPVGLDMFAGVLLNVNGFLKLLFHIHPAFNLVGEAQHEVHLAGLVHLLGSLEEIVVEEIVAPTVDIHGVTLGKELLLRLLDHYFCNVNRIEFLGIQERPCIGAGLFFQETGRRTVFTHHNLTATDILILFQHLAVGRHNAGPDQH